MYRPEIESNLAAGALRRADLNPERTAIIFEEEASTYAEFGARIRRQAQLLRECGV